MKLKPLQDWAIIQRAEPEEKTAGGIFIPDAAKDKSLEGVVLAIGPGVYKIEKGREKEKKKKFIPTAVKPGQRVVYGKYAAREIELDGEMIVLVREEDILGIVEETRPVEKKAFAVEEKQERPVAVKKESEIMKVAAPAVQVEKTKSPSASKKKATAKKEAKNEKTAAKSTVKEVKKVKTIVKKTKNAAPKAL
ncbi:MAG: co-chaperone GroES, partial [Nitrospirota bacterium]|nr:co-chaperone GroES [Nitrospirota bacterium]